MNRDLFHHLEEWYGSKNRKPLILRGARQTGKSWLALEFGKKFKNLVAINFDKTPELGEFFSTTLEPKKLIGLISNYTGIKIVPGETLLFLDEIQNCPPAIKSLRYFYEDMPDLHVLSAGSLLEFELQKLALPVGRIQFLHLYPLSFGEFLQASGRNDLRRMLKENSREPQAGPMHKLLIELVRTYTIIGGMPEVVKTWLESETLHECQNVQSDIIETYRKDFNKYAKKHQVKYLEKLFPSLALQTGSKFKYTNVDVSVKSQSLAEALDLLCFAGVARKIYHTSANGIPLNAEIDVKKFKTVFFDIGLMLNLLHFDFKPLLLNSDITFVNNGALAEQFVAQELVACSNPRREAQLFYWHREAKSSNAEVDYVIEHDNQIIPCKVKRGSTGSMKSLNIFMALKKSSYGVKISNQPFSFSGSVYSVPYYGIEGFINRHEQ